MPSLTAVPLPTTSAPGNDGFSGGSRLINVYANERIVRGKKAVQLSAIHGLTRYQALAGGAIRGMIEVDGYLYVVSGVFLYLRNPAGAWSQIGSISGSDVVYMARNRRQPVAQVGIVANTQYYLVDNRVLLPTPVSPNLAAPIGIEVFNGRFVFPIADGRVFASEVDDGQTIYALAFGTSETYSDYNVGIGIRGSDVCVLGTESVEFWRDTGATPWPFSVVHANPVGCLAAASIAGINQTLVWVANDRTVRMLNGYDPVVISTNDIHEAIEAAPDRARIESLVYEHAGNKFYKISCASFTWVYNAANGFWHEEKSKGRARWRGRCSAMLGDSRLVGDSVNGILYEISPNAYDEDGEQIVCEVHTAIDGYPYGMVVNRLFVDGQTGVGLNTTTPENLSPEIMIDVSRNGGHTWTSQRRSRLGPIGAFHTFPVAHRLGTFDGRGARLRVSCSASVVRVFNGLSADIEALEP
mgnify:CR=1 FL=1